MKTVHTIVSLTSYYRRRNYELVDNGKNKENNMSE